jgi:HTH-type transcriptional regulator/antitoxin HigA
MAENRDNYEEIDRLLNGILRSEPDLNELFAKRLTETGLSQRGALAELDMEVRALKGILNGTQKMVDLLALSRLADFLQIPIEKLVGLLLDKLEKHFNLKLANIDNQDFILQNFDLYKLKKCGFINSINDFSHIEQRLLTYFGLRSIQDYGKAFVNVSYSDGKPKSKNTLMRDFWIASAVNKLKCINNTYEYNRSELIEYVPTIRWQTRNVKKGLYQVIRELFKLGVTVIFEPYVSTLYARAATFAVNNKPCIVLTNYTDRYPSLWFALIHEIHHVLFDWNDINSYPYHVSEELDRYAKREVEADEFAREFLFPTEKLNRISLEINNKYLIEEFAKVNHVHESIIYANYCWAYKDAKPNVFAKFSKLMPTALEAIEAIDPSAINEKPWLSRNTAKESANELLKGIFNGL